MNAYPYAPAALLAAALLAVALEAPARNLYRWVDEDGNVQYSDRRPDVVPPGGYDGPRQPSMAEVMRAQRQETRRLEREEARRLEEEAAARAHLESTAPRPTIESRYTCEQARGFASHYAQPDQEFYSQDAEGNYKRSSPQEVQATLERWQRAAEILCREGVEIVNK